MGMKIGEHEQRSVSTNGGNGREGHDKRELNCSKARPQMTDDWTMNGSISKADWL